MLMGTLFNDAMGRDCMPERFPYSDREGIKHYVALFLQAIGARSAAEAGDAASTDRVGVRVRVPVSRQKTPASRR